MKSIKVVWRYLTDEQWRTRLILQRLDRLESRLNKNRG